MQEMRVRIKSVPLSSFNWLNWKKIINFAEGNGFQFELNDGERGKIISVMLITTLLEETTIWLWEQARKFANKRPERTKFLLLPLELIFLAVLLTLINAYIASN